MLSESFTEAPCIHSSSCQVTVSLQRQRCNLRYQHFWRDQYFRDEERLSCTQNAKLYKVAIKSPKDIYQERNSRHKSNHVKKGKIYSNLNDFNYVVFARWMQLNVIKGYIKNLKHHFDMDPW